MSDKAEFFRINLLESEDNLHLSHKYDIMGTPTIIFFCKGKPIGSIVGFHPKEHLKMAIEYMLNRYKECSEKNTRL